MSRSGHNLFGLIESGAFNTVKQHLAAEPSLATRCNQDGQTILFTAITVRRPDIVTAALAVGADPNHRDREGWTPLIHAASTLCDNCTSTLLAHPATQLNIATPFGWAPLLTAINRQHWSTVRLLLDAGADIHQANLAGLTPFKMAQMMPAELRQAILHSGVRRPESIHSAGDAAGASEPAPA